ncbi:TonB-linked outer membrane protein, SusC/RagA family [Salinivirga cyanobacteriivorans]|uniref:TonB-linked outer membrane protein, SusC/RagA family n=1 Tax=Salinivirga cyanobacteriivorans TaxID=1307839 RepID=A0A0S2HZ75_9BACT|nr:carboxypeptidase-like regulatory domain-containing protein [Salinivirga cyanobacteriivorans]ALO15360.1 TonB-linked outer membrane protein, SusC/RagA family [Salinivirga cyanobacteriivorans]
MQTHKYSILLIILCFFLNPTYSQDKESIEGIIISKEKKTSIPYCSVVLKGTSLGAITQEDGSFDLEVPKELLTGNDTLVVSHIAYGKKLFPIDKETSLRLELKARVLVLDEVTVKPVNLKKFMKEVIENYHNKRVTYSYLAKGFVRESALKNKKHLACFEAKGYLISSGYDVTVPVDNFDFLPTNFRKLKPDPEWLEYGYKQEKNAMDYEPLTNYSGLFSNYRHIERSRYLSDKAYRKYSFSFDTIINRNGIDCWVIKFEPKRKIGKYNDSGAFYIDPSTKRILLIKAKTKFFSMPFHNWVEQSTFYIQFLHVKDKTYVAALSANYESNDLKHYVSFHMTQQKMHEVTISENIWSALSGYEMNPVVYYDPDEWSEIPFEGYKYRGMLENDLLNNESMEKHFASFHNTYYRRRKGLDKDKVQILLNVFQKVENLFF